ncbi:MAG: hypothetical protein ACE5I9_03710 [Candidatus Methylomirabilales bacterium]
MVRQVAEEKSPQLVANLALGRIPVLVKRFQVAEYLDGAVPSDPKWFSV